MNRTQRAVLAPVAMLGLLIVIGTGPNVGTVAGWDATSRAAAGAIPTQTSTVIATSTATPTPAATPTPTETPMPTPALICGPETSLVDPQRVLAGTRVTGWFTGFQPNATVALIFRPDYVDFPEREIGATTTDEHGFAEVEVVIPADAPVGDYSLLLRLEGCATSPWGEMTLATITVVAGLPSISISDDTVVPGQRVTVRATGFGRDEIVTVSLDDPDYLGNGCCVLARAMADADWSVMVRLRLPGDLSPGAHTLSLVGWGPEALFPEVLEVQITVAAGGVPPPSAQTATIPPTDTLAGEKSGQSSSAWPILVALLVPIVGGALAASRPNPRRCAPAKGRRRS